jgi:uncharacterized protein
MKPVAVIIGANGFLGRYFTRHCARKGYEVVAIARSEKGLGGDGMYLPWNGKDLGPWVLALEGAAFVLNLAGKSVNCRYNEKNKKAILDSRIQTTNLIGKAIQACKVPPKIWLNVSTVTWYRHAEDQPQTEWHGERGTEFSVDVAHKWEEAFFGAETPAATRKIALRTGIVMANEAGTVFDKLRNLTQFGLGGKMATGNQRVSWIHIGDWLDAIDFLIDNPLLDGVFNLTTPEPIKNTDMMRMMRELVAMPIGLPAAKWMLEVGAFLMKTETELMLKSRWVEPSRLMEEGFRWRWASFEQAIADLEERRGLEGYFRDANFRSMGVKAWASA